MGLEGSSDVGPDSAVPKQLGRRPEYRPDQCLSVQRTHVVGDASGSAGFGREIDLFGAPGYDHGPGAETVTVVVVPARPLQREEALPLAERGLRIRIPGR